MVAADVANAGSIRLIMIDYERLKSHMSTEVKLSCNICIPTIHGEGLFEGSWRISPSVRRGVGCGLDDNRSKQGQSNFDDPSRAGELPRRIWRVLDYQHARPSTEGARHTKIHID